MVPTMKLAMQVFKEHQIDAIITDNQLMSDQPLEGYDMAGGLRFIESLQSGEANRLAKKKGVDEIPVMMLSAYFDTEIVEFARTKSLSFMTKPADIEELINWLENVFDK